MGGYLEIQNLLCLKTLDPSSPLSIHHAFAHFLDGPKHHAVVLVLRLVATTFIL